MAGSILRRVGVRRLSTQAPSDAQELQRWGARLSHDNTYLSYSRNAIISTVAGGALVQHHKAEGKPPLAGAGLLLMGGMFMYVGSGLYVFQIMKLARPMRLGAGSVLFKVLNACWPVGLWTTALACMLDEYPRWLLEGLRSVEAHLPSVLHASLFFDPPALYPVCKLLQGVVAHEQERLLTTRRHAEGGWSLTKPHRAPLNDLDVASIVARRIERLEYIEAELKVYARSERAVPTAYAAPLLEKLRSEVEQLEKVLESDIAPGLDQNKVVWWVASLLSAEHRKLRDELEACRALSRRIVAVRFTAVEFAARGQTGALKRRPSGASEEAPD